MSQFSKWFKKRLGIPPGVHTHVDLNDSQVAWLADIVDSAMQRAGVGAKERALVLAALKNAL